MATFADLPPEILRIIAQLIYLDHLPRSLFRCIDPHGLPSTYPDGRLISSTQQLTQNTLYSLCLTSSSCYHAAKPLLWRRLQIKLPYSFLLLLRSLGVSRLAEAYEAHQKHLLTISSEVSTDDDDAENARAKGKREQAKLDKLDKLDFDAMLAAVGLARVSGESVYTSQDFDFSEFGADAESLDLVWKEEEDVEGISGKSRYHVTLAHEAIDREAIHRFPRIIDFSTFTTQGMRRTVGEGQDARFVTPSKLLALITAASSGLMAFGASSSMDSALSLQVLEALLFRDSDQGAKSRHHKLRGVSIERSVERGVDRKGQKRLEALDLCNCVSVHFEAALRRFVDKHLRKYSGRRTGTVPEEDYNEEMERDYEPAEQEERRGRPRSRRRNSSQTGMSSSSRSMSTSQRMPSTHPAKETFFTSVERLSLHGVYFAASLLSPLVLAFPCLTHLDLTGTRIEDDLLDALGMCTDVELESLSLARCTRITSRAITDLLVDSTACGSLTELSLEGSILFPTPLAPEDLRTILTMAPCMRSGHLRYLDLGGCGMTDIMIRYMMPQPSLLDFGLSATPRISLEAIAHFLTVLAPNVQVLELVDSCYEQQQSTLSIMRLSWALLEPCTTVPPLSISEQIKMMGLDRGGQGDMANPASSASSRTNLRVIGMSAAALRNVGGALGSWHVIHGKGRRGWLVDVRAGPNPEAVDKDLSASPAVDPVIRTDDGDGKLPGITSQLFVGGAADGRGRHGWRGEPSGAFEPETPPRRASRSPSMHRQRSKDREGESASRMLLRRATSQSQSRSRSRPPVVRENPLQTLRDNARRSADQAKAMEENPVERQPHIVRNLPEDHPRVQTLKRLSAAQGHVPGPTGWHSKKMEVLLGLGMMGRESGLYAYAAYQA